jgi:FlaA1/EpsC-like NDP-sugar epimerase
MKKSFLQYLSKHFVPRWVVFLFDTTIVLLGFLLTYYLRFNLDVDGIDVPLLTSQVLLVMPVYLACFLLFKPYRGIVRHTTTRDAQKIIIALTVGLATLLSVSIFGRDAGFSTVFIVPISIILVHYLISIASLIASRVLIKAAFIGLSEEKKDVKNVLVFGAGVLGQIARNALEKDQNSNYRVIGFIDDNKSLQGKDIFNIPIYALDKAFEKVIKEKNVTEIIIGINKTKIKPSRKREIIDYCIGHKLVIKEIPEVAQWFNGELNPEQIRKVNIEDLLGRDSIKLDVKKIQNGLKDATILVTGAAGSIGSEIVRQLLSFKIKKVILLDQAESALYDLQNEIQSKFKGANFELFIADVTNNYRMRQLFDKYHPDIVFNAAAYKHVPLMESNPYEAIRVNIGGIKNLADLSVEYGVKKFVMISTDKAVNPTNVMGASKRICEIYVQGLSQQRTKTQFITTRFGNVLGSNGSVIPLFRKQIENGGPVTVTHKDITRYFMTIPEACQLVLEAGFMGQGGEIYLFDMGEPIKIYDLAVKMISLSGFEPHKQIEIAVTGLRPGEKLYEELLASKENTLPTYNDKIMIGQVQRHDYYDVSEKINSLLFALNRESDEQLVSRMKNLVPEFVSQNSKFSIQDKREVFSAKRIYDPVPHPSTNVAFAAGKLKIG